MLISRVDSWVIISRLLLIILPRILYQCIRTLLYHFSSIFIKITIRWRLDSHQLPGKYPQLPAFLISPIETLMWCIYLPFVNEIFFCISMIHVYKHGHQAEHITAFFLIRRGIDFIVSTFAKTYSKVILTKRA